MSGWVLIWLIFLIVSFGFGVIALLPLNFLAIACIPLFRIGYSIYARDDE